MRPAEFEYYDPRTFDQALSLLERHGEDAKVLAGGQSLVPLMKLRLATPQYIIDITKIPTLAYITENAEGELCIGVLSTHHMVETSALVKARCPILSEAAINLGDTQVRNRGTIGGNLCHADPACEYPAITLALDAKFIAVSSEGERIITAGDFFRGILTTSLKPSELLKEIRIPPITPNTGQAYQKLAPRSGDFPIVAVAVVLTLSTGNICESVKIGLGAVASTPIRAQESEKALVGKKITGKLLDEAAELAIHGIKPTTDTHATKEYKTEMTKVITRRALHTAFMRAGGKE